MAITSEQGASGARHAAERLRIEFSAVRLGFTWLGVRKTLSPGQKAQAADTFGAEGEFLSAGKKLIDTKHPAYKAVTAIRGKASQVWKGLSLPYPETGVRLIRQDRIEEFDGLMRDFSQELEEAVRQLNDRYSELKDAARERLGSLFDESDYPPSLEGMFVIEWSFPSVEPPAYLRQLNPDLYQQECQRVASRFDEAVRLAEEAFLTELSKLVEHLTERLSGQEDGKPKVFRDSAVENLTEFFQRFRSLNVRSSQELEELVERAQRVVTGVEAGQLRTDVTLRQRVASELSGVQSVLDGLLVDRPRRNILRKSR